MYVFIVNPIAGNGRAKRVFSTIMKSELYRTIVCESYFTKYRGHAEVIAQDVVNKHANNINGIIVVGGDGTMHEVVNGIGNHSILISFIPGGSGNDFARGCSISGKPIDILFDIIHNKNKVPYWMGSYKVDNELNRTFVNSIGFGFDAEIAETANKSRYKKILNLFRIGTVSYVIALIHVLFRYKPFDVELEIDGQTRLIADCWMITISNHPYYGGGMKIIPNALIEPSVFPVLLIRSISKWKILGLFMTVFTGRHIKFKEVELIRTSNLKIHSKETLFYQVDGETFTCKSCVITKQSESVKINGIDSNQKKPYFEHKVSGI